MKYCVEDVKTEGIWEHYTLHTTLSLSVSYYIRQSLSGKFSKAPKIMFMAARVSASGNSLILKGTLFYILK